MTDAYGESSKERCGGPAGIEKDSRTTKAVAASTVQGGVVQYDERREHDPCSSNKGKRAVASTSSADKRRRLEREMNQEIEEWCGRNLVPGRQRTKFDWNSYFDAGDLPNDVIIKAKRAFLKRIDAFNSANPAPGGDRNKSSDKKSHKRNDSKKHMGKTKAMEAELARAMDQATGDIDAARDMVAAARDDAEARRTRDLAERAERERQESIRVLSEYHCLSGDVDSGFITPCDYPESALFRYRAYDAAANFFIKCYYAFMLIGLYLSGFSFSIGFFVHLFHFLEWTIACAPKSIADRCHNFICGLEAVEANLFTFTIDAGDWLWLRRASLNCTALLGNGHVPLMRYSFRLPGPFFLLKGWKVFSVVGSLVHHHGLTSVLRAVVDLLSSQNLSLQERGVQLYLIILLIWIVLKAFVWRHISRAYFTRAFLSRQDGSISDRASWEHLEVRNYDNIDMDELPQEKKSAVTDGKHFAPQYDQRPDTNKLTEFRYPCYLDAYKVVPVLSPKALERLNSTDSILEGRLSLIARKFVEKFGPLADEVVNALMDHNARFSYEAVVAHELVAQCLTNTTLVMTTDPEVTYQRMVNIISRNTSVNYNRYLALKNINVINDSLLLASGIAEMRRIDCDVPLFRLSRARARVI